jgi:putative transposase
VVALGIDNKGNKQVLDFVLGSSENSEVSRELMGRIVKRGFHCEHRLYVVLDGSDALRVAVREFFPDAIVQRCLVHKERNIQGKLSKRHWGELSRFFTHLPQRPRDRSGEGGIWRIGGVPEGDQRGGIS